MRHAIHAFVLLILLISTIAYGQGAHSLYQQSKKAYGTNMDSVPIYLEQAIKLAEAEKNDTTKYSAYIDLINYYGVTTNHPLGDSVFLIADKEITESKIKGRLYVAYGYFNKELANYKKAQTYLLKAYDIGSQLNDLFILCGSTLNISRVYKAQNLFDLAIEYSEKSLEYAKKGKFFDRLEVCYNQLASLHKALQNYHEAERYYFMVRDIVQANGDKWGLIVLNNNMGNMYTSWNKVFEAENLYKKNLILSKETNNVEMYYYTFFELSNLYYLDKDFNKSKENIIEALKGLKHLQNNLDLHDIYWHAYRVFEADKDYETALDYHKKWKTLQDTIFKMNTDKLLFEIEAKYRNKEKQRQIVDLNEQNKEQKGQIDNRNMILIFSLIFILAITVSLIFLWRLHSNLKITKQNLEVKNIQIEEQRKEIIDSINYAKRIQYTLLAHNEFLNQNLKEHFVLFKPKDIVSGDFYWAVKKGNKFYLAVCDSTGHGVPGAFMSLLNISFLNEAINERNFARPDEIFNQVREKLIEHVSKEGQQDGFDGVLICIDKATSEITYAAANNTLVLISGSTIKELPFDRMPVGLGQRETPFSLYNLEYKKDDMIYVYTDGFADQFGGEKGKKFKYKKLNELLVSIQKSNVIEQKEKLDSVFENWRGQLEQVDDVCVIGIRI